MADGIGQPADWSRRMASLDPRLMLWLSPSFPVGAFAFSHGLEQAAARGWIRNAATLEAWLRDLIQHGSLRNDLILMGEAWRAARSPTPRVGGESGLSAINALALALQPSVERHLETRTQGNAFFATIHAAWPCEGLEAVQQALFPSPLVGEGQGGGLGDIAYPVAVGAVAAAHGIALDAALMGYALAFAGNLISAAIRLSVIGQTDGQRVMAALMLDLDGAAFDAATSTLDDLGSSTFRSDLAQLAHETLYSRLFRS